MVNSIFNKAKITGIKTVIPEKYIDIDDELVFFDNNPKKLARAKKMMGYGRRYLVDKSTTVVDLAVYAAEKLLKEMNYDKSKIELLIFVNQKPDYREPSDACIAHGRLNLDKNCAATDILLGCSGYTYALWTAMSMIESGAVKNCLLLAGDIASFGIPQNNRKSAQLFGDAASATIIELSQKESKSTFVLGTDGKNWDKIVTPFGGIRLQPDEQDLKLEIKDGNNNLWTCHQPMMKGEDVFNFSVDVAPNIINEVIKISGIDKSDIDFFAIHQANKQIVETIAEKAEIPAEKTSSETFTKYANNSTNSVVTVICDQLKNKKVKNILLCTFGIGLSWAACTIDFSDVYNGGIDTYISNQKNINKKEQIDHWIKYFKGEE